MSPTWSRPHHEPTRAEAQVDLLVFADRPLAVLHPSRARHGYPSAWPVQGVAVTHQDRERHPKAFDDLLTPPLLAHARRVADIDVSELVATRHRHTVRVRAPDPGTLAHLQAAWAVVRAILDEVQPVAVLDAQAIRWWGPSEVACWDPGGGFDVAREISIVFEGTPSESFGHVMHTRGLAKVARPELLLLHRRPADARQGMLLLNTLGQHLAEGAVLVPGGTVQVGDGSLLVASAYRPGRNAPEVGLTQPALVLQPDLSWT